MSQVTPESRWAAEELVDRVDDAALETWTLAGLTFGLLDVATTFVGLTLSGVHEAGPIAKEVLGVGGYTGLLLFKLLFFAVAIGIFLLVPAPYSIGIPLGLSLLGIVVVANNVNVIGTAAGIW